MKRSGKNYLVLVTILILGFCSASQAEQISTLRVEGNRRVDEATVFLQVASKKGAELSAETVRHDIKEIYKTGFFDQVEARVDHTPQGLVLVFVVQEKPAIRSIKVEGNEEISDDTLKEQLNVTARRFLDRKKIALGVEQAKTYYQSQGLYGTEIEYEITNVDENLVDLTYRVHEGKKKVVRQIVFEGAHVMDSDDLQGAIQTDTYSWWKSWLTGAGNLQQDKLEEDVKALSNYYLNHGYVDVRVATPTVEEIEKGLKVVFRITEGDQYKIGTIGAAGTLLDDDEAKTLQGIELKTGDTFDLSRLRKDTFTVSEKFTDIGYAFANVEPATEVHRDAKTVDVKFQVNKGNPVTVNRIVLSGNQKTRDNVIRREFQIQEQELFSSSKIRRSQELVQRLGYFDEVAISPSPAEKPDQVDLNVNVREGNTGTFSVGAGVSSGEGFIATAQISENNLFGSGDALTFNVDNGTRNQNFVLSFENPRVNDSYFSYGAEALSVTRIFDDFDRDQTGGSMTVGYPLAFLGEKARDDYKASVKYELLDVNISNLSDQAPALVREQEGHSTSSSITPSLTRNTVDNPLDPSDGSRQNIGVELAGLGGDQEFWLLQATSGLYYPLFDIGPGPLVFSQRTRFGYGEPFKGSDDFPLFRRFFPGGINSVRGFDARKLGPKDEQGRRYGGSKQLVLNFELIFPLLKSVGLQGVTFYDAGNAFDDDENIQINDLRQAVGWGLRWKSPIAPIRIEFGYPLQREPGEKSFVTNFSFGSPL